MRAPADGADPSPLAPADRVAPRCVHFGACGGCAWQHIAYAAQLRAKRAAVIRALGETLDRPVRVADTVAASATGSRDEAPWGFRRKVHFVFAMHGTTLVMGHYREGSREVLPVDECPVHPDRANALAFVVRDALRKVRVPAGPDGIVKHLVIRVSASRDEMLATLVVTRNDPARLKRVMRDVMASPHAPTGWFVNVHPKPNALLFGETTMRLAGRDRLREDVRDTSYLVSPDAFFQTNVEAADALVAHVLEAVPRAAARVLDLYAGAGLFSLPIARRGSAVLAVEESGAAVADGDASRVFNRIASDRCRFVVASVDEALRRNAITAWGSDVVVLDPPRVGAGAHVMQSLCEAIAAPRMVYVSCDPAALARDLALVAGRGGAYTISSVTPFDMFPHTPHVETVAVLDRR